MSEAKNHHWVPQCYLKGFTKNRSKNSSLAVRDLRAGKSFTSSPRGVGASRDFNRAENLPRGEVEKALSGFEGIAATALQEMENKTAAVVTDNDWITVVNLIALLAVRNPRWREQRRAAMERISKITMDLVLSSPQRFDALTEKMAKDGEWPADTPPASYAELKRFHEKDEYTLEMAKAWQMSIEFQSLDGMIKALLHRRWTLAKASTDSYGFITSDHPVCLFHRDGSPPGPARPLGHAMTNTIVTFPITSTLLAIGEFEEPKQGPFIQFNKLQTSLFNSYPLAFAERQVYARDFRATCVLNSIVHTLDDIPKLADALKHKDRH